MKAGYHEATKDNKGSETAPGTTAEAKP